MIIILLYILLFTYYVLEYIHNRISTYYIKLTPLIINFKILFIFIMMTFLCTAVRLLIKAQQPIYLDFILNAFDPFIMIIIVLAIAISFLVIMAYENVSTHDNQSEDTKIIILFVIGVVVYVLTCFILYNFYSNFIGDIMGKLSHFMDAIVDYIDTTSPFIQSVLKEVIQKKFCPHIPQLSQSTSLVLYCAKQPTV
jgi:hypothetical protein